MRLQRQLNKLNEEFSQLGNAVMLVYDYLQTNTCFHCFFNSEINMQICINVSYFVALLSSESIAMIPQPKEINLSK